MEQVYCFADIPVRAVFRHAYLGALCRDYETQRAPRLTLAVEDADIVFEQEKSEDGKTYSNGYLEGLAFYRKLATAFAEHDVLLFHGSAVCFDGKAYIFTAPSGTGKSTHTGLCAAMYGDRFFYINDDKPLLRRERGVWYVYGTPWDGKHHLSTNTKAPLGGICFLHRGQENAIHRTSASDAFARLVGQTFRPSDAMALSRVMALSMDLAAHTPLWNLFCTVSPEAAALSLPTMAKENQE